MSKRAWILLTIGVIAIVVAMLYLLDITRYKPENEREKAIKLQYIFFSQYKVEDDIYVDEEIIEILDTSKNIAIEAQISKNNNTPYISITIDEKEEIKPEKTPKKRQKTPKNEVINHKTGEKEILEQDENNLLILRDENGNSLWQRQLDEEIIGNVTQIDYYKNHKLQYLFRTKTYIYLIDRNGNNTANFPVPYLNNDHNNDDNN